MNKKIIRFTIIIMFIILLSLAFFFKSTLFASKEIHTFGVHGALVAENSKISNVINEYCLNNQLDYARIEVYEATYLVNNSVKNGAAITLPILNPNVMKNILGVYSSIPLKENKDRAGQLYNLEIDPSWLKNKPRGILEEPLIIRYVYQTEFVDELPEGISISQFSSKILMEATCQNPNLKLTVQLAEKIKRELPIEKQDDLKSLIKAYAVWIDRHIAYPAEDLKPLVYKYTNLKSPDVTLGYRVGVCEDNAYLLKGFLNSQGIEAFITSGKSPNSLTYEMLLPDNNTAHAILTVKGPQGYFTVDPTTQSIKKTKLLTLKDGKILKVSSNTEDINFDTFPMFIELIDGYDEYNSPYMFELKALKCYAH